MTRPNPSTTITTLALATLVLAGGAHAANHREAPITALDHKADITDVYAFVSYDDPSMVTMIMSVDPLLEPANGPTLFPFDPNINYQIKIDNNQDAEPDVTFSFRFTTEYQLPDVYTAVAGIGPDGADDPNAPGVLVVPPMITSFADVGLNQRQTYTVRMSTAAGTTRIEQSSGAPFFAIPGNAGPRTMDYEALFAEGTYDATDGIRVLAGTTDDAFYIDLGATFDTANFRTLGSGVPGVLTASEDDSTVNLASDTISGFAVNSIAIEVPITMLTSTGEIEPADSTDATIGVWATTSRRRRTIRQSPNPEVSSGGWRQVQRMGNPLINELLIGIGTKDTFSMSPPAGDEQFTDFFLDPPIVRIVEALYGGALAVPEAPRLDLLPLVVYAPPIAAEGTPAGPIADLLRLNTGVPATDPSTASRLGLIGGDPAGFPNGRRVSDDVVDIVLRVAIGGVLADPFPDFDPEVNGRLGDGVNANDTTYRRTFPYLGSAPDGRNRRHVDPGEIGGGPVL